MANHMLELKNKSNILKDLVENNKRLKRKNVQTDLSKINFPVLTEDNIRNLTIGFY